MTKLPITIAAATALLCGTAALAQTPVAKTTTKTTAVKATPAATKTTVTTSKSTPPATAVHATTVAHSRTTTTTGGRMVQAKLKNGKTVTYDCSKAGNQKKTACK